MVDLAWGQGTRPDPSLTVSEWADEYRRLSPKSASEPGKWRTVRTPYLRKIMDALSASSPVVRVALMKGAQLGGTEAGFNWIGYVIHHAPGPMLAVQPTTSTAKRNSKQRIAPMIAETPELADLVSEARARDSGNTLLAKEFPGGILVLAGANSAADLRSMPARYLFLDEVDAYPGDVDGEGDPIALAEARSRTFSRRKVLMVSTPTIDGRSRIQREHAAAATRWTYQVPCPTCGTFQALRFQQLRWTGSDPRTARYICEACEASLGDEHKTEMLERGDWFPDGDPNSTSWAFHLSSLYSPVGWLSWVEIATAWIAAQGDQELLKTFVNTILAETWKEKAEAPEWQRLYDRREEWPFGTVPSGVLFLTAGVDVQADRIEVSIWGWGRAKESWLVEHRVLMGDTARAEVWDDLQAMIVEVWPTASGVEMRLLRVAVDSGHATTQVYDFARLRGAVMAVDGRDRLSAILGQVSRIDTNRAGKKVPGVNLWPVGVSIAKAELYGWLRLDRPTDESGDPFPAGYVHLSKWTTEEQVKQLVAERLVTRKVKGFSRTEWQKMRERNEVLDCRNYARAAAAAVGLDRFKEGDWIALERALGIEPATEPKPPDPALDPPPAKPPTAPTTPSDRRRGDWLGDRRKSWLQR
ncbi:MAG: phage terminase large subunit family protein [Alphaproteobacteria bacterium]